MRDAPAQTERCSRLQYFQDFFPVAAARDVVRHVDARRHDEEKTVFWLWLPNEPVLGAFFNRDRAALFYAPTMLWSSNPRPAAPEETVAFVLEDRQAVDFPADVVVTADDAVGGLADFLETGRLSDRILWS